MLTRYRLALMIGGLLLITVGLTVKYSSWVRSGLAGMFNTGSVSLTNPFAPEAPPAQPLRKYAIASLSTYAFQPGPLVLGELLTSQDGFDTYSFTFRTLDKTMSGVINLPTPLAATASAMASTAPGAIISPAPVSAPSLVSAPVLIMVRGYVPPEIYAPGVGTKNAAAVFVRRGFVTIAPDFFGYGSSDPEFADPWEARLTKPVSLAELILSVKQFGVPLPSGETSPVSPRGLGMWAHSNGGQIALTTLEALGSSIPTSLWAPVTAPFPYSILFFGDEQEDEGKAQRAWIAMFEKTYDVFEFSLTKHLDLLRGPLQIHHGTLDDAALYSWSVEFTDKLKLENDRREAATAAELETGGADTASTAAEIEYRLYTYPGADHNLQPLANWNTAIERDVEFFSALFN